MTPLPNPDVMGCRLFDLGEVMRILRAIAILLALVLVMGSFAVTSSARPHAVPKLTKGDVKDFTPRFVPGEAVVEYRKDVSRARAARALSRAGARVKHRLRRLDADVVRLPRGRSVVAAVRRLRKDPAVVRATPNWLSAPLTHDPPNDPLFPWLWNLENRGEEQEHPISGPPGATSSGLEGADAGVHDAWDDSTGDPGVVIAVMDTGVDVNHPDLASNIWVNPDDPLGDDDDDGDRDDDHNGYPDDVNGWDFAEDRADLLERDESVFGHDHGTHVAGIAAAAGDNNEGIIGVCPTCSIMPLKVFRPFDVGRGEQEMLADLGSILAAIDYAISKRVDVVNMSFGRPIVWDLLEWRAMRKLGRKGILATVAAGNSTGDNDMLLLINLDGDPDGDLHVLSPDYPSTYSHPGIVSVAASNHNDEHGYLTRCSSPADRENGFPCTFSNWGNRSVDLWAPGVDIQSTVPGGYATFDGTSMAAPHVAGAAGLLKSIEPDWTAAQIKHALLTTTDQPLSLRSIEPFPSVGPLKGRFTHSRGRLNVSEAAGFEFGGLRPPAEAPTDDNMSGAKRIRRRREGRVSWPNDINDVYKKRLRKGRRYKVKLVGPRNEDFDLYIWKPKTREIWQLEDGCFGSFGRCKLFRTKARPDTAKESLKFKVWRTGKYYMHVSAWLFSSGNYTLRVRRCTRRAPRC